jgi:hypothetical protein
VTETNIFDRIYICFPRTVFSSAEGLYPTVQVNCNFFEEGTVLFFLNKIKSIDKLLIHELHDLVFPKYVLNDFEE